MFEWNWDLKLNDSDVDWFSKLVDSLSEIIDSLGNIIDWLNKVFNCLIEIGFIKWDHYCSSEI